MKENIKQHRRIACVGDSITYGYRVYRRDQNSYPAKLQKLLGDSCQVGNFGCAGLGVLKDSMKGTKSRAFCLSKYHRQALKFLPDLVICNLGINDLIDYQTEHTCGKNGIYGKSFVSDYKALILDYLNLETNPKLLVWGPLAPLFPGQLYYGSPDVEKINQDIKLAVDELNAETNGKRIELINMRCPLLNYGHLFRDKLHPNKEGADLIAKIVCKSVENYHNNEFNC